MSRTILHRFAPLLIVVAAALSGCGGGGGGSGSPTGPGVDPTAPAPGVDGPAWQGFGRDAQHTAMSAIATQDLSRIAWTAAVDLAPQYTSSGGLLTHYGSPVVSNRNTIVLPVKTGATDGFRIEARSGVNGGLWWSATTDYLMPPHNWLPSYNLQITPNGRLYAPGAGGKLLMRATVDTVSDSFQPVVFYGAANYNANPAAFNSTVFINTPLVSDAQGNVFFGFMVTGTNPAGLTGGIARVAADGTGRWVAASTAASDAGIQKPAMNSAPALSSDGATVYVAVNTAAVPGVVQSGYLLALDSTTLATKSKAALTDPLSHNPARISDNGTSSPAVGPDGHVFFGVLEPSGTTHNLRGWLLQFNATLQPVGAPGSFGWDVTPTVIPASMVPSYSGASSYLLALKYNNYEGVGTGDGLNRLAILDPAGTQADPITPAVTVMREVLTILAPTFDSGTSGPRKEWCINTMAADAARKSIIANNEDGILYRWDLTNNTLSQSIRLGNGLGQAYTPTIVGADGAVYAISNATLFAVRGN